MGYSDFLGMDSDDFAAVARAYAEREESRERGEWERMRLLAAIAVQPHCRQTVSPSRLLPFPWDADAAPRNPAKPMDARERRARMDAARRKLGERY